MAERLKERWAFRLIYIREAHAKDVWPIGAHDQPDILEPRRIEDRLAVARRFLEAYQLSFETWVDDPAGDPFETVFAAWPFRFYVVSQRGVLLYKARPTEELTFCPVELESKLRALAEKGSC